MEQRDIMNELDAPQLLRQYLLGMLDDEIVHQEIEERLMIDDEFAAQVAAAEGELIEEFLDDELSTEESDRFNRFFLAPPERRRQLRLIQKLREVSSNEASVHPHPSRGQSYFFASGWLRPAAAAIVLIAAALGVWWLVAGKSDTQRGLENLQAAYRDRRPTESRITALPSYAPYLELRGDEGRVSDTAALDRAERYFRDASEGGSDATARHAYAMYFLSAGDLKRAQQEIEQALRAAPGDARIQNDAAAIQLEIAKQAGNRDDHAAELIALQESMKHLDAALALDPGLLDARFNRALALGRLRYTEEAKDAWRDYLERDGTSKWADEARRNLEQLDRETPRERSADELESDFLAAIRTGNEVEAEKLVAGNRELITDLYLPTRLAMSYVSARGDRRDELLRALQTSGEIETRLTGDTFAKEIAHFYGRISEPAFGTLVKAHSDLRTGYVLCRLDNNYRDAHPLFENARRLFEASGDDLNAKVAEYFVAYALANLKRNDEALALMNAVASWAGERNHIWLQMTALFWVAGCHLNAKQLTDARRTYEHALDIAERIDDSYARQRNLVQLSMLHSICGQERAALGYLFRAVKDSDKRQTSLRQRYRNLFNTLPILFQAGLLNAARPAAMEAIKTADRQENQMWAANSRAYAGIVVGQMGYLDEARELLADARSTAAKIKAPESQDRVSALTNLRSGDFELLVRNPADAERFYADALRYYEESPNEPALREEAHQGMLLTYLATERSDALEQQIPVNIALAEEYRTKIFDEQQSISFFDLKGNIFDIAAEFEFDRGNLERAYEYAERSSSRALLDRMQRQSAERSASAGNFAPLSLNEIRAAIPEGVQIVQYSIFGRKIVVWIISRHGFSAIPVSVDPKQLSPRVSEFAKAVSNAGTADDSSTAQLGRELHQSLIEPVIPHLNPANEVCIIPSKFLFDVPFAALIDAKLTPLIATFRIIQAPSANVFIAATRNAAERAQSAKESVLAVGNPTFDEKRFQLEYLSDSEREVEKIAQIYAGTGKTLTRHEATAKRFLSEIQSADVVHFAGHYVAMPGAPMSSFLLLAKDGDDPAASELTNLELARVSLSKTRLMVLAACQSGIESYYRSEGMAGMSRTILAAQVPLVVASQWSVDSAPTAALMARFHEHRRKNNLSTTAALRQAQLDLKNDPTGGFSSPFYWAAFSVYGGHADF